MCCLLIFLSIHCNSVRLSYCIKRLLDLTWLVYLLATFYLSNLSHSYYDDIDWLIACGMILASESQCKGSNSSSIRSLVVNEVERPGHWSELVLCVIFSAQHWWLCDRRTFDPWMPIPLIPRGSFPEHMKEKDPKWNQLTQILLGHWLLNGGISICSSNSSALVV